MNTYYTWDQQDPLEDNAGHDYDGIGWYRATFNVDSKFKDRLDMDQRQVRGPQAPQHLVEP